jgi:hypothetical protein
VVVLVATIAAVVSYMYVATLALHYGQPPLAAYLLPLSIDRTATAASLVLPRTARNLSNLAVSSAGLARNRCPQFRLSAAHLILHVQ